MAKAMTLRLADDQREALETMADVEEKPVAELIRVAIDQMIERAREDAEFQNRRAAAIKRHQALLDKLARV